MSPRRPAPSRSTWRERSGGCVAGSAPLGTPWCREVGHGHVRRHTSCQIHPPQWGGEGEVVRGGEAGPRGSGEERGRAQKRGSGEAGKRGSPVTRGPSTSLGRGDSDPVSHQSPGSRVEAATRPGSGGTTETRSNRRIRRCFYASFIWLYMFVLICVLIRSCI